MTDNFFESLTTLTNQQDVDSLQKCFLALLADLFPISYAGNLYRRRAMEFCGFVRA